MMDQRGYVMGGISILLILPVFVLLMVAIELQQGIYAQEIGGMNSESVYSVYKDFENNIPILARQAVLQKSEEIASSGQPLFNSRNVLKNEIQTKMNGMVENYSQKDVIVNCTIVSVSETENPLFIEINSTLSVNKNGKKHSNNLSQRIPLCDDENPLIDPIPFIKCHNYGGVTREGNRIYYGHSLVSYLDSRNISESSFYENATSPQYIKNCPYNPYSLHGRGDYGNFKNCLDNGFYHESNDGACFLCRLEGKVTCSHQGLETFIIPPSVNYQTNGTGPCSVDHVLLGSNPDDIYPGYALEYFETGSLFFYIFLDNAHRTKYGFPDYSG